MNEKTKTAVPADLSSAPLALVRPVEVSPYEPQSYAMAKEMAKDFCESKLTKVRTQQQAILVMATGRDLDIPATTALRMIYVADFGQGDQISLSADLMVALCLRRKDVCEYFRCLESTDEIATYATKRRGDPERTATFTIKDKERAGLGAVKDGKDASKTNWAKYPRMMLRHRAAAELAREVYPDIIGGFYTADELRETVASESRTIIDADVTPLPATTPPPAVAATDPAPVAPNWERLIADAATLDDLTAVGERIKNEVPAGTYRTGLSAAYSTRKLVLSSEREPGAEG